MIISKITGGLGNQLFMYACGYAASKRMGTDLVLDTTVLATDPIREYELAKLNIEYSSVISVDDKPGKLLKVIFRRFKQKKIDSHFTRYYDENPYKYNEKILGIQDNTYLDGYWQSEKYFADYREDLIRLFQPQYSQSKPCLQYIAEVSGCESVAVHIRRGDYTSIVGKPYYRAAINMILKQKPEAVFYVFSDDLTAARALLGEENDKIRYVQFDSETLTMDEFFVMKACKHQIIANSTFSWWAAWLNENPDRIVICPQYNVWSGEFYPEQWIQISYNDESL